MKAAGALRVGALRVAALGATALGVTGLSGCATTRPASARPVVESETAAQTSAAETDWHALVRVPFGTRLAQVPFGLDEVLTFHAESARPDPRAEAECYEIKQGEAPPRWFSRPVERYSLCFASDRLSRIEASVSLSADTADARFAAACARWRREVAPGAERNAEHAAADSAAPGAAAGDSARCEATDGGVQVRAQLATSAVSGAPVVSVVLTETAMQGE